MKFLGGLLLSILSTQVLAESVEPKYNDYGMTISDLSKMFRFDEDAGLIWDFVRICGFDTRPTEPVVIVEIADGPFSKITIWKGDLPRGIMIYEEIDFWLKEVDAGIVDLSFISGDIQYTLFSELPLWLTAPDEPFRNVEIAYFTEMNIAEAKKGNVNAPNFYTGQCSFWDGE